MLLPGQQRTKSRCADGIILINGGLKSMDDESSPAAPSSPATAKTETDTSGETPSPSAHAGDLSAEVNRKDLLSSVARVVSPPPLLSLLEDVLDERIVPAEVFDTAGSELDKHDDDGEISIEAIRSLSEAFVTAEATIDAELEAFMNMATLAGSNDDDDADDVSITTHGTTEEVEISEKERQELEQVDEVAMLLRQNSSRYAYDFGTCRTTSGVSDPSNAPPLTPTRRAIASTPLSSPAWQPSSRSFDVMSNTRIHQRAVSRLKRQYCYLAATRNAAAFSDLGAAGSEGDSGDSIAESELVANVLLLQAERMAKKVTRSYDGPASPKCTLSPLKGSVDLHLSPFSLSISPIRTVSATADRSAAKASPEQLAAIEKCLREGEALTSASTKIPQRQEDFSVATAFAAPAPIPFLPTDNEMVGLFEDQKPSRFAPRFALPCLNSPKIKETISENKEEDDDDEENDTLSPLPPSSLAKSDRWAKYKKKGLKGRNSASSLKSIGGIANTGKNLQARRQLPNQHFSIFQQNLVSMKKEEAKKKALREKKEQFIEDARNKKLYDSFVMLKAAAATKSGCAGTVNGAWLKEGQWFIDFDTFDTDSDEKIQGDERGPNGPVEKPTHKFAANLVGGFRKHIVRGGQFGVPKRIVRR